MSKKFLCVMLASLTLASTVPTYVFADSNSNSKFLSESQNIKDESLTNLLVEGKDSYKLIKIDGNKVYSQFTVDNSNYIIEEEINDNYDKVLSKFYKLDNEKKEFIGQTETILNHINNNLSTIQVIENNKIVDFQYIQSNTLSYNCNEQFDYSNNTVTPFARVEYAWHHQGTYNGSNLILKFTVGAIIVTLTTATGSPYAAGLGYIVDQIIQYNWKTVWWTRDTYAYNSRCPDWPSYPHWVPEGKYRYRTKFYSNSSRTQYISSTDYTDG